jgi:replicative DNA helicase
MAEQSTTYEYAEAFQQRIVALCLKDPVFLRDYEDVINPKYFDYDYLSSMIRVALEHVTKHNEVPSKATLTESLREFCQLYKISPEDTQDTLDKVHKIYSIDLLDPESVKERVLRFGRRQALKSAVMQTIDIIDSDTEYDRVNSLIQGALNVGQNTHDLGIQAYGSFLDLPSQIAISGSHDKARKIPSLFSTLDRAIFGGPGRKEVWVVMGLPGVGKSQWLTNIGAAAVNQGYHVVHITVGDLDEIDVFGRYAARLTHMPIREVIENSEVYRRRAAKMDQYLERYLRIKYYPSGSVTCSMIRAYLARLIALDGIKPDVLIIDYPDKFKRSHDNDYTNMGHIYSDLGGIAGEFDCLVWVASQVQRWSPKGDEEVITQDNVADSWRKAQDADGIVTLNQTVAEYKRKRARGWIDKVRRGEKHILIQLVCDFTMSYMREMTAQEMEEERKRLEEEAVKDKERKQRNKNAAKNKNLAEGKRIEEELEAQRAKEEETNGAEEGKVLPFRKKEEDSPDE